MPCYCGNPIPYSHCCQPWHQGGAAPTAEALMRSRYSAFVLKDSAYLQRSLHPSQRADEDSQTLAEAFQTPWLGLQVLAAGKDWVEFCAFYQTPQGLGQLHEYSYFVQEGGQWFYRDGRFLPPLKLERNQTCPCGSGKKYKHCHLA